MLDFGLAREDAADEGRVSPTESPTLTSPATRAGVILGTATYMSPEQARGRPLDKRTDVWSFGCVIYEVLTGRPPFSGETVSDTIAAILERQPDWSALPANTPPGLRRLLRRCLEKDRKHRLRDIGDARVDLEDQTNEPPANIRSAASTCHRCARCTAARDGGLARRVAHATRSACACGGACATVLDGSRIRAPGHLAGRATRCVSVGWEAVDSRLGQRDST